MLKRFWEKISKSIEKDGQVSSSRIFSYFMMGIITLFGLTAIAIELVNAIKAWNAGTQYVIPSEHIVILGMWLAHQLTLLGIYKKAEKDPEVKAAIKQTEDKINEILPAEQDLDITPNDAEGTTDEPEG